MNKNTEQPWRFSTRAIHIGQEPDPGTGATVPPIHPTSTYTQASPGRYERVRERVTVRRIVTATAIGIATGTGRNPVGVGRRLRSATQGSPGQPGQPWAGSHGPVGAKKEYSRQAGTTLGWRPRPR